MTEKRKAADFCLRDQSGVEQCLSGYRGQWVVLYFYPRDMTPGCSMEAVHFTWAKAEFDRMGAVVLGVSPDSEESHRKFCERKDLSITLLSDTEKTVLKAYGCWKMKKLYGKEFLGVERSTFLIDPDGYIAHEWRKVRVKDHVDAVLLMLGELTGK